ncbi:PoNe immunity protein domain-containing protein [Pasteurella sp. PK-2025]|uniref:PoNe immunity protein domain-containing protein n=1 Tax=unclassified Pasteurella TaxID=2621516 RepID=UPI003C768952
MKLRDKLNTFENYNKMITFNKKTIAEFRTNILALEYDEHNGIQRYPNPNKDIIESTKRAILMYQEDIMLATYSSGYDIDTFNLEYTKVLEIMYEIWKHTGGYTTMLNILSIAIILDLHEAQYKLYEIFFDPERKEDFEIKDHLLDFLFQQCSFGNKVHKDFMIAKPYALLREIIEVSNTDKSKAVNKLKIYLQKNWFSALKRQDLIQETHKSPHGTHCGYWSFESGALVKILGLDDSILKDQQYYPYDLVHYKKS